MPAYRKSKPSTEPLSPEDETIVREWSAAHALDADPGTRRQARTIALLFRTGMHPVVLALPVEFRLRYSYPPRVLSWNRPKTLRPIRCPLKESELPWLEDFLKTLTPLDPSRIRQIVHEGGAKMGMPELTPRALRHDLAARLAERNVNAARELTGTTLRVLIGYAQRREARDALERLTNEGF